MYLVGAWVDMETVAEAAAEEEDGLETGSGTKDFNIETKNKEIVTKDRDISTTYIYVWKLFATRGELDLDKGLKLSPPSKDPNTTSLGQTHKDPSEAMSHKDTPGGYLTPQSR